MGFGASVGLRRAALGARSVSAVGSEPGLQPPPLYRGVQPLARPRPGQERRWVRAGVGRGARAARSGSGGGHGGRSPPPPAARLRSWGAGRVGAGVPPAGPRLGLGQGLGGLHLVLGRPPPARGPGAERPRGARRVRRAGGRERGRGSGLKPRRSGIGPEEFQDRLSHPRYWRPVRKSGPGWGLFCPVAPARARPLRPSLSQRR